MPRSHDLIGGGWSFPLRQDSNGAIALSHGEQEIDEAMQIILMTRVGERVMRPAFGSRLHELLFAPLNVATAATARQHVIEALRYWEPRIDVVSVDVTPRPAYGCLEIAITYQIRTTYDERTLVVPFYTIPEE